MGTPREFMTDFPCQMSAPLMSKIVQENPQPDPFVYMDDSSMNFQGDSQIPAGARLFSSRPTTCGILTPRPGIKPGPSKVKAKWKKSHERTSFTHTQYKELEALFSCNMFPDKNLQRELALKLNLPESTVKIWFRNRRFKMKKQQQQEQQSPKPPSQVPPAKDVPTASTSPHSFLLAVSDSYNSLSPQSLDPFPWAGDSMIMEIPTSDVQMQDPQLERLVASVPALYSDAFDITQIMELYSFPDEDDITNSSFYSLYQYLSPTRPS
ncbi:arginine-fifty homeobox [Odocoileus virginianus]|uniref:Arginine-fifty homeobox n=1 Tax=Odocoileus virginianus TaxID=9874 RepID=A0ABM4I2E7_ODOVR